MAYLGDPREQLPQTGNDLIDFLLSALAADPMGGLGGAGSLLRPKPRMLPALYQGPRSAPPNLPGAIRNLQQALKALAVKHPELTSSYLGYKTSPGRGLGALSSRAGGGRKAWGTAFTREGLDELLGLSKQGYHDKARLYHPDVGGSADQMSLLNNIYEFVTRRLNDLKFTAPPRPKP